MTEAFKISIDWSTLYDPETRTVHITRWDIFADPPPLDSAWGKYPIDVENLDTGVTVRFAKLALSPLMACYVASWKGQNLTLRVWKDAQTLLSNYTYLDLQDDQIKL